MFVRGQKQSMEMDFLVGKLQIQTVESIRISVCQQHNSIYVNQMYCFVSCWGHWTWDMRHNQNWHYLSLLMIGYWQSNKLFSHFHSLSASLLSICSKCECTSMWHNMRLSITPWHRCYHQTCYYITAHDGFESIDDIITIDLSPTVDCEDVAREQRAERKTDKITTWKWSFLSLSTQFHRFHLIFPGCSLLVAQRSSLIAHKHCFHTHSAQWTSLSVSWIDFCGANNNFSFWCSFALYHSLCIIYCLSLWR